MEGKIHLFYFKEHINKTGTVHLERSYSLPKKVESVDDTHLNIKFEQNIFRSKSKRNISNIMFNETRFETFTSSFVSQELDLLPQDQEI